MQVVAMFRVLALFLATAMLGSSVAREFCLIQCASPSVDHTSHHASGSPGGDAAGQSHACHESNTSALPAFGALPHGCDHDAPEPPSVSALSPIAADCPAAVGGVAAAPAFLPPVSMVDVVVRHGREPIPLVSTRRPTRVPLRI
jgi:hypothetical protein